MIQKLIEYFSKFQHLTDDEKSLIQKNTEVSFIPKNTILLKEEALANTIYFVVKGCVRQYYLLDGEEKTSCFFTENEWILPFTDVENNGLSKYNLECLEDSYLVITNDKKGNDFLDEFPKFYKISQQILEKEIIRQQNELSKYINQTAEQRYLYLQENRPDLIHRVPQYLLSSYIGVKPESLSRIRKRIATNLDSKNRAI